jgi:hypothetical protein
VPKAAILPFFWRCLRFGAMSGGTQLALGSANHVSNCSLSPIHLQTTHFLFLSPTLCGPVILTSQTGAAVLKDVFVQQ